MATETNIHTPDTCTTETAPAAKLRAAISAAPQHKTGLAGRDGYKQTAIGWIPEEWEVETIGKGIKLLSGQHVLAEFCNEAGFGTPYLTGPSDFSEGKILTTKFTNSPTTLCSAGDILVTVKGSGTGKIIEADGEYCISRQLMAVRVEKWEPKFVFYILKSLERRFEELSAGLIPGISRDDILLEKMPLPRQPEQKAIANLLSTWDKALDQTNQLITQKELRKKWLMQQLLTGKKRLPGFAGEWKEVRLGSLTSKISRRNRNSIDAAIYSVTNSEGFVLQSSQFGRNLGGADQTGYKIIKNGEFAYNPARINVGSIAFFKNEIGLISSLYVCFSTKSNLQDEYLLQLLQDDHTKHKIGSLGEGGVRVYLWYELFANIKIPLPEINEQAAIANFLGTADHEINLLKSKLASLKEQKKGLLQVLLTGKVRLV